MSTTDHGDRINDVAVAALLAHWKNYLGRSTAMPNTAHAEMQRYTLEVLERLFELGGFDALRTAAATAPLRKDGKPCEPVDWFEDFRSLECVDSLPCADCGVHFHGYKRRTICKVCAANKLAGIKRIVIDTSNTLPEHAVVFEDGIRKLGDINERLQMQKNMLQHTYNEAVRQYEEREAESNKRLISAAVELGKMRDTVCRGQEKIYELETTPWILIALSRPHWTWVQNLATRFGARTIGLSQASNHSNPATSTRLE